MEFYNAIIAEKENATVSIRELEDGSVQTRSGTGEATIESVSLHDDSGQAVEYVPVGDSVSLRVKTRINSDIPELVVGYQIKDRLGQPVFGTNTHHLACKLMSLTVGEAPEYRFSFPANLGVGSYSVAIALHTADTHLARNYEWLDLALVFNVVNVSKSEFVGLNWLPPSVECLR
jgi:lipopolysaccharide transport system ATP-binding protein